MSGTFSLRCLGLFGSDDLPTDQITLVRGWRPLFAGRVLLRKNGRYTEGVRLGVSRQEDDGVLPGVRFGGNPWLSSPIHSAGVYVMYLAEGSLRDDTLYFRFAFVQYVEDVRTTRDSSRCLPFCCRKGSGCHM